MIEARVDQRNLFAVLRLGAVSEDVEGPFGGFGAREYVRELRKTAGRALPTLSFGSNPRVRIWVDGRRFLFSDMESLPLHSIA